MERVKSYKSARGSNGWVKPALVALISMAGAFLVPALIGFAFVSVVMTGLAARNTETVAARWISHLAALGLFILLIVVFIYALGLAAP